MFSTMKHLNSFQLFSDQDWLLVFLEAYCFGGVVNHALTLAIHEISHNIAFGNQQPMKNRLFGMLANLPIGVPMSVSFKKYHIEHHRYLGEETLDTDVPTELEGMLFNTTFKKAIWLLLQPFFYAFRPMIIYRKVREGFVIVIVMNLMMIGLISRLSPIWKF